MVNVMYVIAEASLRTVIQHYINTFVGVAINILFAFGLAWLLKYKCANRFVRLDRSKWAKSVVEKRQVILVCLGSALLLVAGIGKLGWSIQTYGGTTPAENLNERIFLVLSHLGTFLIFVDISLTALNKKPKESWQTDKTNSR